MTRYLITGSSGFIGRHLCRHLQSRKCQVKTISRSQRQGSAVQQHWQGDLLRDHLPEEFIAGTDVVIHLAGLAHQMGYGKSGEAAYFKLNRDATLALAAAAQAAAVKKFIFVSSVKAARYDCLSEPNDETNADWPDDPYGLSKREAEEQLLNMPFTGMQIVIIRPCLVYGAGVKGNLRRMLRAQKNAWFPSISGGGVRSMVSVHDLCTAIISASQVGFDGNQTFIVADGQQYTIQRIVTAMRSAIGRSGESICVKCSVLYKCAAFTEAIQQRLGIALPLNKNMIDKLCGSELYSAARLQTLAGWQPGQKLEDQLHAMLKTEHLL